MSSPPGGALPFPTAGIPIIGSVAPAMRIKINEETIDILPPSANATPEQMDAFGALAGAFVMAKSMGAPPWPDIVARMTVSYRDRFQPIILGD